MNLRMKCWYLLHRPALKVPDEPVQTQDLPEPLLLV